MKTIAGGRTKDLTLLGQNNPGSAPLLVEPSEVRFDSIKKDVRYVQTIYIRNVSTKGRRVRLGRPSTSYFRLHYENFIALAPGLTVPVEVEYYSKDGKDANDVLVIQCEDEEVIDIPLKARRPTALFEYPTTLNFGPLLPRRRHIREFTITNVGTKAGVFEVKVHQQRTSADVMFTPNNVAVEPGESLRVKAHLSCDEACSFQEVAWVSSPDVCKLDPPLPPISVEAVITGQNLRLLINGQEESFAELGSLYFGQTKEVSAEVINDGPHNAHFRVAVVENDPPTPPWSAEDPTAPLAAANIFSFFPSSGEVPPFGKLPVTIRIATPVWEQDKMKGFRYNRTPQDVHKTQRAVVKFESEEFNQTTVIQVAAFLSLPALFLDPPRLDFGKCLVDDRRDVRLALTNKHKDAAIEWELQKVSQFFASPNKGRLAPQQTVSVVVSFCPRRIGVADSRFAVALCKGLYTVEMDVSAEACSYIPVHLLVPEDKEQEEVYSSFLKVSKKLAPYFDSAVNRRLGAPQTFKGGLDKVPKDLMPNYKFVPQDMNVANALWAVRGEEAMGTASETVGPPKLGNLNPSAANPQEGGGTSLVPYCHPHQTGTLSGFQSLDATNLKRSLLNLTGPGVGGISVAQRPMGVPADQATLKLQAALLATQGGTQINRPITLTKLMKSQVWGEKEEIALKDLMANVRRMKQQGPHAHDARTLALQIVNRRRYTQQIDFGKSFVKTTTQRCLSVFNDTAQSILVDVNLEGAEELSRTDPLSQVVPSAHAAGFDLMLNASVPQRVQRQITVTINGRHPQRISITGELTPVTLNMSREDINFSFSEDTLEQLLTEQLILTNPGNGPAYFRWGAPEEEGAESFNLKPLSGVVKPKESVTCEIAFMAPSHGSRISAFFPLHITDGLEQVSVSPLQVAGQADEALLVPIHKRVEFGSIPVGHKAEGICTLANPGGNSAIFHVMEVPEGISVHPMRGRVGPDSRDDLQISALIPTAQKVEGVITLSVRGGKPVQIPIAVEAVIPDVRVSPDELDFKWVTLGAVHSLHVTMTNYSSVEASLYVSLVDHPEFALQQQVSNSDAASSVQEGGGNGSGEGSPRDSLREKGSSGESGDHEGAEGEVLDAPPTGTLSSISVTAFEEAMGISSASDFGGDGGEDEMQGGEGQGYEGEEETSNLYKLLIPPLGVISFEMTFTPVKVFEHSFELPVSYAQQATSPELQRVVHAKALKPRLLLSLPSVDFAPKVIQSLATGAQSLASEKVVAFVNADESALAWQVDTTCLYKYPGVFEVATSSGVLDAGEEGAVRIQFQPKEPLNYLIHLPIFLSPPPPGGRASPTADAASLPPIDKSRPYLHLRLRGRGTVPKIAFDRPELILPTVPLNVPSRALFKVYNEGFELLELRTRLPADSQKIPLKVEFPEGNVLGSAKERCTVEVSFVSPKPVSFTAKVEILDSEDHAYPICISGTADNSVLTTHGYLEKFADFFSITGDPPILREEKPDEDIGGGPEKTPSEAHSRAPSAKSAGETSGSAAALVDSSADFLSRWLSSTVLKSIVELWPQDLIVGYGKPVIELTELLSGKSFKAIRPNQPPPEPLPNPSTNPKEDKAAANLAALLGKGEGGKRIKGEPRIVSLVLQFENFLTFLKQHGALLCHIRPEWLLPRDMFVKHVQAQPVKNVRSASGGIFTGYPRRHLERQWTLKAPEAWMTVCLQILRVFLLNRLTPRAFRTVPGLQDTQKEKKSQTESGTSISKTTNAETEEKDREKTERENAAETAQKIMSDALDLSRVEGSNVFSASELMLLKWLTFHYNKVDGGNFPLVVTNFETDLRDSIVFASAVVSHAPDLGAPGSALASLRRPCVTPDHFEQNASKVVHGLQELGLQVNVKASDLAAGSARDLLIFSIFLFQTLPQYIPRTTLTFATALGVRQTKLIDLTNPSRKRIVYRVQIEGGADFTLYLADKGDKSKTQPLNPGDSVALEARETRQVHVEFNARFSKPSEAKLLFTSKREGAVQATALVFRLSPTITSKRPLKRFTATTCLYEPVEVDCEIASPVPVEGEFFVALSTEKTDATGTAPVKSLLADRHMAAKEAFWTPTVKLRIGPEGKTTLKIQFLPLEMGNFLGTLMFKDTRAGEFVYEIFGVAHAPKPVELPPFSTRLDIHANFEIPLGGRNPALDAARGALMDRQNSGKGKAARRPASRERDLMGPQPPKDGVTIYTVRCSSPYFQAPTKVAYVNTQSDKAREILNKSGLSERLLLDFQPSEPGMFPCTLHLSSSFDTRVLKFEAAATPPPTRCQLSFRTAARRPLVQEIPITNSSENEWTVRAKIEHENTDGEARGSQANVFEGPSEIKVKKAAIGADGNPVPRVTKYNLTFNPSWICSRRAILHLNNLSTSETAEFFLVGEAEEPDAEGHIVVQCEARSPKKVSVEVPHYGNQPVDLEVETDLLCASGPEKVRAVLGSPAVYEFEVLPLVAGNSTACIIFRDRTQGTYVWYTVELNVAPPKPQKTLELRCNVRSAVSVGVQLSNPLDDNVTFDVTLTGEGLLGDSEFTLAPKESSTYELAFSPLLEGSSRAAAVFVSPKVGEFWYDLILIADPPEPISVEPLQTELGVPVTTKVSIENPVGYEVALRPRCSNKTNFRLLNSRVIVPPFESTELIIEYSPSSVKKKEEAELVLDHPEAGKWVLQLEGEGLPPVTVKETTAVTTVNKSVSTTLHFKNPFLEAVTVDVKLRSQGSQASMRPASPTNSSSSGSKTKTGLPSTTINSIPSIRTSRSSAGVFNMLLKKTTKITVGPLATLQLPVAFNPPALAEYNADVMVVLEQQKLVWNYRIRGVVEAPVDLSIHAFNAKAREHAKFDYSFSLVGYDPSVLGGAARRKFQDREWWKVKVEAPSHLASLVERSFKVTLKDSGPSAVGPDGIMPVEVHFAPLKPFSTTVQIILERGTEGRWRFQGKLNALFPDQDDSISIEAPVGKRSAVSFRLTNYRAAFAPFEAYFTADHPSSDFSVSPSKGVLEPADSEGTEFVVTYFSREYGRTGMAKLVIETGDMLWSFNVRGGQPKYIPPNITGKRVDDRVSMR
uniref:Calponin-homology (CH) domain-containing protein n=1 Tax=Chromera velia CCMP2878 TaxID=1169474 RepID=A0A0G4F070_9ALVE|eukprot:Cvel_14395.t1-p1 / transcript=Cvel_14395.t1 / gene=Cvel_14395 / organism=Chromera_velia_CCMP2878 / gene_product=Uncharacterized protein CXorf22, putative / transcript_product=Uncharacterized protein CXorf22, putative / location=Cvel_scaffold1022:10385-27468(+) / protein_length=3065 / sequence_SO=supercontig / SO=protein_coding / is_pseudo=false